MNNVTNVLTISELNFYILYVFGKVALVLILPLCFALNTCEISLVAFRANRHAEH